MDFDHAKAQTMHKMIPLDQITKRLSVRRLQGPVAQQMAQALQDAQVFRLTVTDATTARHLYDTLEVVAIVTIPADFDLEVESGEQAPILVQANKT